MKFLIVSVFMFTMFTGCFNSTDEKDESTVKESGTSATANGADSVAASALPSFQLLTAGNEYRDLAEGFKGKKLFVNLWATWCGPCKAEIPSIQKLAAKTDPNKVAFVLLSLDNNFETAKVYAEKTKMGLPIYYPAGELPALFNVQGIPTTFIFNEKGEIIHQQVGTANYDTKEFEEMLK